MAITMLLLIMYACYAKSTSLREVLSLSGFCLNLFFKKAPIAFLLWLFWFVAGLGIGG